MAELFDEKYLAALPESVTDAASKICEDFFAMDRDGDFENDFDYYVTAWFFARNFVLATNFPLEMDITIDLAKEADAVSYIREAFEKFKLVASARKHQIFREKFESKFHSGFYEFSTGDLKLIQDKINELRDMISNNEILDDDFKSRLLRRLESLQRELHKTMASLDRFWGLFADAGVALGKFGNDAKPLFDRVKEVLEIVWRTQARAEELPSDSPPPQLEQ